MPLRLAAADEGAVPDHVPLYVMVMPPSPTAAQNDDDTQAIPLM